MNGQIDATLLPDEAPCSLRIQDGAVAGPLAGHGPPLVPPGGFVLPGLVDVHGHADFPQEEIEPDRREAFVRRNLRDHAGVGTLVLRDMGASARTLDDLSRGPGEPRVLPAGHAVIGCDNHCFPATSDESLVNFALSYLRPGVRWIKLFSDWPDPSVEVEGKATYFRHDNPLTYSPQRIQQLVEAVHGEGGRIASHAFTEAGARASIDAGADSIEHGWGLTEPMLREMAERGIAWVPLLGIAPGMLQFSGKDERPDQEAWIEECLERMQTTLPLAVELGVPVLTGTDWFPVVTLADEAAMMVKLGLTPTQAIAAATVAPRRFLGLSELEAGAPADLVWYADDPREDLSRLTRPGLILADGERIEAHEPTIPVPPEEQERRHRDERTVRR